MTVLDLFAGPGGWDLGARSAGLDPIGIELDPDACATRAAAGLRTIRADLAELTPDSLHLRPGHLDGLIASPPCPAFSSAGNGLGRAHLTDLCAALQGFPPDWPWQGTKASQARQVGNAVPPPLAQRILEELAA